MDPERWKSIESLYHAVLGLDADRRSSFLSKACSQDPELRREVESLIGYVDQGDRMFGARAVFQGGEVLASRFRIVRLIGAGGMGEVYESEDLVLGEPVALKAIRFGIADQERMRGRLLQEVRAAKRIAHPGVCRIHDLHIHEQPAGELTFLTMELLRGETLGCRLRNQGRMEMAEASAVAQQLTSALSAAHNSGVIHRDFKPENVILEPRPKGATRAVVTDFGLARSQTRPAGLRSLTTTGHIVGTLAYMAPEQLLGEQITPAVDIYALGLVLYEMITGVPPFSGNSELETAARRLDSDPPSPRAVNPSVPLQWDRAIVRCLQREPTQRLADAGTVWKAMAVS